MSRLRNGLCSFCGTTGLVTREHVVPIGLFPDSTRSSARFVLIPSCESCNKTFSEHEEDFRTFCTLASHDKPEVNELFDGPLRRALDRPNHGVGLLKRIFAKIKESGEFPGRYKISPDSRVILIVRKIIRGLAFEHCGNSVLSDEDVYGDVIRYDILPEFNRDEDFHTIHPAIFRYYFTENATGEFRSLWLLKIFETVRFIGAVLRREKD